MEDKNKYIKLLTSDIYYTAKDLRYNNKEKIFLSNEQLQEFKQFKKKMPEDEFLKDFYFGLDLLSFNNAQLYFIKSRELLALETEYLSNVLTEINDAGRTLNIKHYREMLISRAYSEIEGSLAVENVPTTRTRIEQLSKGAVPNNRNEQIVKNMIQAINYVSTKPEFNKENLNILYKILSDGCLEESQILKGYYRDAPVYIDRYDCCDVDKIEDCMNSLFTFVNSNIQNHKYDTLMPHIAHYYIVYVHPYFDYNGRTARMVSLWISMLLDEGQGLPIYLSEAINDNKHNYYEALRETRDMENDLSYFIIYLYKIAIKYYFVYKNVDYIEERLLKKGNSLTTTEKVYIKKILVNFIDTYFDYKRFIEYANIDVSKQGALKMLNRFEEYGVLESIINDKKVKLFKINNEYIKYLTK